MPLIVMLHGCTQNAVDFATGTQMNRLAEKYGCFVLYPEQSRQLNVQGCWNWFEAAHQERDQGEPLMIAESTRQTIKNNPIDPERVYVAGLSAGGAMAALVADCYPEIYSGIGIHSGLPAGAASSTADAFTAMRGRHAGGRTLKHPIPTVVFHGSEDSTVHPLNATHIMQQLKAHDDYVTVENHDVQQAGRRVAKVIQYKDADGRSRYEHWDIIGAGHAWAGGNSAGSHTDPTGPDASEAMLRFFLNPTHSV